MSEEEKIDESASESEEEDFEPIFKNLRIRFQKQGEDEWGYTRVYRATSTDGSYSRISADVAAAIQLYDKEDGDEDDFRLAEVNAEIYVDDQWLQLCQDGTDGGGIEVFYPAHGSRAGSGIVILSNKVLEDTKRISLIND